MNRRGGVILALLLATATSALAGGMRDLDDAWLMSADAARSLLQPARPAGRWRATVAHGRLYDLPDLPQSGWDLGGHWPAAAATLRWRRLGRDIYREDSLGAVVMLGRSWRAGVGAERHQLRLAGGAPITALTVDLRVRAMPRPGWTLDAWWPLTERPPWQRARGLHRLLRLTAVKPRWAAALALDRNGDGGGVPQGELLVAMADRVAVGLRIDPWSGTAGLVTVWRTGPVMLRSSHLAHPDLGATHRWSVSW